MIADYLNTNYFTLLIILVLAAVIFSNRDFTIPATRHFNIIVILVAAVTIFEYLDLMTQGLTRYMPDAFSLNDCIFIRTIACTLLYMIRPFIILLEIIAVVPGRRNHVLLSVPAVLNALLFLPAVFGARFVFYIDVNNRWHATPLRFTVYIVQLFYVLLLIVFSLYYLEKKNSGLNMILLTILILSFSAAFMEKRDIIRGVTTPVSVLCVLTYYIYLTSIYKQQLYDQMIDTEKKLSDEKMELLRSRIQPHFIYNSINIIRTLERTDEKRAVEVIDYFSDYLKAHFRNIETEDMIPFDAEIENVKAFLSLAEADTARDIQIVYDLEETDFLIPQLSLEPVVENAVRHGIDECGGTITISSFKEDNCYIIRTTDTGNDAHYTESAESDRLAIGISNTRKRLDLLCNGRLQVDISPYGTTADIIIPVRTDTDTEQSC